MDASENPYSENLDPEDWERFREEFHRAVDLVIGRQRAIRDLPVWSPPPRMETGSIPMSGQDIAEVIDLFQREILPYGTGNTHPRFFGWVHGSGNLHGALGEALAALMNCNVGGRDHIGTSLEKQVVGWFRDAFGFPRGSSGILTGGTSMGTLIALTCARNAKAPWDVQASGMQGGTARLVAYASSQSHGCLVKAMDLLGLGRESLRLIPSDDSFRLDPERLEEAVRKDRSDGLLPFCVISTMGSVNTGAVDDLERISAIAGREGLWHHVDGAFGAFALWTPEYAHLAAIVATADSMAFDMHKWLHVPYDAGCVLVRDGELHARSFRLRPGYLQGSGRGLAGGEPWFCDYGPDLSRGFRALKVWFTLRGLGFAAITGAIRRNCSQARLLGESVAGHGRLELLAPVSLNIVCLRFVPEPETHPDRIDRINAWIVEELHLRGLAAPSTTTLAGRLAIRVCLTNHRTRAGDLDQLLLDIVALGIERSGRPD